MIGSFSGLLERLLLTLRPVVFFFGWGFRGLFGCLGESFSLGEDRFVALFDGVAVGFQFGGVETGGGFEGGGCGVEGWGRVEGRRGGRAAGDGREGG